MLFQVIEGHGGEVYCRIPALSTIIDNEMSILVDMTTLGARLRHARLEAKLSQEEAGRLAGVSKQAISHIENDRTKNPEAATLEPLSRRLGVSLQWLMTGKGAMSSIPNSGKTSGSGVETVSEPSTPYALASQFERLDAEILLVAERWAQIFETAAGGKWTDLQRKQKEVDVYAAIVADGGKLSDEHHAGFLRELTELTQQRTGGQGDERGEESAGRPAVRRVGGRH